MVIRLYISAIYTAIFRSAIKFQIKIMKCVCGSVDKVLSARGSVVISHDSLYPCIVDMVLCRFLLLHICFFKFNFKSCMKQTWNNKKKYTFWFKIYLLIYCYFGLFLIYKPFFPCWHVSYFSALFCYFNLFFYCS